MRFEFWVKYFKVVSLFFVGLGLFWAYSGSFDPFGIYDYYLAKSFWQLEQLPPDVAQTKMFILAPLGTTSAGFFTLQYFIIKYPFAKKEIWALNAIIYGFLIWFVNDCALTIYHGAYFNLLLANLPSLLMMMPIFFMKKYFLHSK